MPPLQLVTDYYRFCPGEEHVKISNAICRGRRRASFPKCPNCPFNDDAKRAVVEAEGEKAQSVAALEAIFGRHEICATVPSPLSEDVAWRIGHAAAQYLHGKLRGYDRANPDSRSIVVSRDLRRSSEQLFDRLVDGIQSIGVDVIDIGHADTPQLYFAVHHFHSCGGIQITGGAKPAEFSGFKLCSARAAPLSDATGLAGIRDIALRVPRHRTGMSAQLRKADLAQPYGEFIQSALPAEGLKRPIRVVIDASNGVAAQWARSLFQSTANLKLELIHDEPVEPFAHDPEPLDSRNTADLRTRVKEARADLGVCFSGDADRCVFVDEKGRPAPSDLCAALIARAFLQHQRGSTIVLDLRASLAAFEEIQSAGGIAVRERVGYLAMRKRMLETNAIFGADLAGRFYFRDHFFCESPFLALAHLLTVMSISGRKLGDLLQPLQKYRSSGELTFQCEAPDRTLRDLADLHADARIDQLDGITVRHDDWWFNARRSDNDPLLRIILEARTKKLVDERLAAIKPYLGPRVS